MPKAIVTGATSGIGRAIAMALHAHSHDVLAIGRRDDELAALQQLGLRVAKLDVTDAAKVHAVLADEEADVLVNNAGVMPPLTAFSAMTWDDVDQALDVNLRAALAVTHAVAPGMRRRGRGHIFFTGSTAALAPVANMAVYAATKAALGHFAQSLRLELADAGVRVTEIVAGRVETGLYRDILSDAARAAMYADHVAVQPEDVAAMVMAVLALPAHANVARFDILPTRPVPAIKKER